jgi:hypothetical protein
LTIIEVLAFAVFVMAMKEKMVVGIVVVDVVVLVFVVVRMQDNFIVRYRDLI